MHKFIHVTCPLLLSDFNETLIFSTEFRKMIKYQLSLNSVHWEPSCSMRMGEQTDRYGEADSSFSQFCERSPKIALF